MVNSIFSISNNIFFPVRVHFCTTFVFGFTKSLTLKGSNYPDNGGPAGVLFPYS